MPLIVPSSVPLVVASPPALVAPGIPSVLPAPYVLRHPALSARALEELAEGVRRENRDWDPRPWWQRPSWPDPPPLMELDSNDKVFLSQGDDFSDLRGHPGLNFVVTGSVSGKTVRLTGAGTQAKPIVLRGASDDPGASGDGSGFTELVGCDGALFTSASTRCILYRFRCNGCTFSPTAYDHCRIARCRFYGNTGFDPGMPINIPGPGTAAGAFLRVDRCVYGEFAGARTWARFISMQGGNNTEACYNHILGYVSEAGQSGETIINMYRINVGQNPIDRRPGFSFWGHHTLVSGCSGPEAFNLYEGKVTDAIITDNTILYDVAGGPAVNIRQRHGLRAQHLRNLSKYTGGGRGGGAIQIRDVDHLVGENASLNEDGTVNAATQITLWGGNLDADTWLTDRVPGGGHNFENCKRATCGGNAMPVQVGMAVASYPTPPNGQFGADGCVVPPDGDADGNASSTLTAGWNVNTDRLTGPAGRTSFLAYRLASARALVALGPTDVGLALP